MPILYALATMDANTCENVFAVNGRCGKQDANRSKFDESLCQCIEFLLDDKFKRRAGLLHVFVVVLSSLHLRFLVLLCL